VVDAPDLLAAAALVCFSSATGQATPNGQFIVLLRVVRLRRRAHRRQAHTGARMRARRSLAFAWCLLGGILGGALFVPRVHYFIHSPGAVHGEDYGRWRQHLLPDFVFLSPIAGFLTGFPVALAIYAWLQSRGPGTKPSGNNRTWSEGSAFLASFGQVAVRHPEQWPRRSDGANAKEAHRPPATHLSREF